MTLWKQLAQSDLESVIKNALIRLRHLVPSIALRIAKLPTNDYQMIYRVPESLSVVQDWVAEIVFFEEGEGDHVANHDRLAHNRWWKARDCVNSYEVHVAPATSSTPEYSSWTMS